MEHYIERIIEQRKRRGLSQEALAHRLQLIGLDISRAAINKLEHGERRLDPDELRYFAAALDVDPNWIVGWDEFLKRLS
jgi:transcriptional regulator with XRE-family HTH domain